VRVVCNLHERGLIDNAIKLLASGRREAHDDDNNIARRRYFLIALAGPFIFMCMQLRRAERAQVCGAIKKHTQQQPNPRRKLKKPNRTHAARAKKEAILYML
jgi:hypothetical protein